MVGGSLANAPSALAAGAYSSEPLYSEGLVLSYSFLDGDVTDSISGDTITSFVTSTFYALWSPTSF